MIMNKNFIFSLALLAFVFSGVHGMEQMKKGKYVPVPSLPSHKKPKTKWLEQFNDDLQGAVAENQFISTTIGSYVIINGCVPSLNRVLSDKEKTSVLK